MKKLEWNKSTALNDHDSRSLYVMQCDCGKSTSVRTQRDNNPEYYTKIFVQCFHCAAWIPFDLPVN